MKMTDLYPELLGKQEIEKEITDRDYILYGICAGCKYFSRTYDGGICHVLDTGCIYNTTIDMIEVKIRIKNLAGEYKNLVKKKKQIEMMQFVHVDFYGNPLKRDDEKNVR